MRRRQTTLSQHIEIINKSAARNCVEMKPSQTTSTSVATSFTKTANLALTADRTPEEDGPQCIDIGSEFSSVYTGDVPDSHDQFHDYTRGPCPSFSQGRLSVVSVGQPIIEVQLKVPLIRITNRVGIGRHPIVDFQQNELPREDEDP